MIPYIAELHGESEAGSVILGLCEWLEDGSSPLEATEARVASASSSNLPS